MEIKLLCFGDWSTVSYALFLPDAVSTCVRDFVIGKKVNLASIISFSGKWLA